MVADMVTTLFLGCGRWLAFFAAAAMAATAVPARAEAPQPIVVTLELSDDFHPSRNKRIRYAWAKFVNKSDETYCLNWTEFGDFWSGTVKEILEIRSRPGEPVRFSNHDPFYDDAPLTLVDRYYKKLFPEKQLIWSLPIRLFYDFPDRLGEYEIRFKGRLRSYEGCAEFDQILTTPWTPFTFDNRPLWRRLWDRMAGLIDDSP